MPLTLIEWLEQLSYNIVSISQYSNDSCNAIHRLQLYTCHGASNQRPSSNQNALIQLSEIGRKDLWKDSLIVIWHCKNGKTKDLSENQC